MPVDFDFTSEQYALRDMAREVFEKESSPARLRELWNGAARDARAWKTLAEVGILGLTVPAGHGGAGGDALDLALVLEEAGRAALPEPLVETVAVAAPLLAEAGSDALRSEWLPRIASGDAIVAVRPHGSPFATDADSADLLVVFEGDETHAIPRGSFTATPARSMDRARALFTVEARTSAATLVSADPAVSARAYARGAAATAGVLNGVGMRLVEATAGYVKARHQFGRPVGSFQAVQHKVADMFVAVESARAAAWYAAYADARSLPDRFAAAHVAKACASEAGALANTEALQCHGGIGFTWEHDLHFWLKRGKALERAWGSAADHRVRLADVLFADA